jgi:hypothetical protein
MESKKLLLVLLSMVFLAPFTLPAVALASNMTSGSFEVIAPVFHSNGFSSSGNFRLFGSVGQNIRGINTSNNFQLKSGFQYYAGPGAAAPAPTPTPGPTSGGPILAIFQYLYHLIVPCGRADLNCDGVIDLVDAGMLFYWWGQPLQQPQVASMLTAVLNTGRPSPDLNEDVAVDIFDLSQL